MERRLFHKNLSSTFCKDVQVHDRGIISVTLYLFICLHSRAKWVIYIVDEITSSHFPTARSRVSYVRYIRVDKMIFKQNCILLPLLNLGIKNLEDTTIYIYLDVKKVLMLQPVDVFVNSSRKSFFFRATRSTGTRRHPFVNMKLTTKSKGRSSFSLLSSYLYSRPSKSQWSLNRI